MRGRWQELDHLCHPPLEQLRRVQLLEAATHQPSLRSVGSLCGNDWDHLVTRLTDSLSLEVCCTQALVDVVRTCWEALLVILGSRRTISWREHHLGTG